ncbi:MAG: hypothetical protein LBE20_01235 [Deltaproteobacteria bacterium]|jgi:hypothetical protein|nr:hypothetical protein [Deltaproteobacteria bacterium]
MKKFIIFFVCFYCFLNTLFFFNPLTELSTFEVYDAAGKLEQTVKLPFSKKSKDKKRQIIYKGTITTSKIFFNTVFHIVVDDKLNALEVNGQAVDISHFGNKLRDYHNGFRIDLKDVLKTGANSIVFDTTDYGGTYGLKVNNNFNRTFAYIIYVFLFVLIFLLFIALFKKIFSPIEFGIILLFFCFSSLLLVELSISQFSNDAEGHRDYVAYILDNFRLPTKNQCWSCYHPALYFVLAAIANYILPAAIGFEKKLQVFTFFISLGFVTYALLILRKFISKKVDYYLIASALLLMPSMVIHSVRVGNDSLFYLLSAMTLFYGLTFLETRQKNFLVFAALAALFSLFAKLNGFINLILIGLLFGYTWIFYEKRSWQWLLKTKLVILSFIIGLAFLAREVILTGVIGNYDGLGSALRIAGKFYNFVWLDVYTFLKEPAIQSFSDVAGRQYFWNYFLKSAINGEWNFPQKTQTLMIHWLSFLWLILVGYNIFYFFRSKAADWNIKKIFLFGYLGISIAALIFTVIRYSFSCAQDFRYVYPILIPFFIFLGLFLEKLRNEKSYFAVLVLYCTLVLFVICSLIFNSYWFVFKDW